MVILLREEGILKIGSEKDIKAGDWQYRISDASEGYMLIDLDHGKAQYLVKSILNDLSLFPELRMLKILQITLYACTALVLFLWVYSLAKISSSEKSVIESITLSRQSKDTAEKKIKELINAPVFPQPKTSTWTDLK